MEDGDSKDEFTLIQPASVTNLFMERRLFVELVVDEPTQLGFEYLGPVKFGINQSSCSPVPVRDRPWPQDVEGMERAEFAELNVEEEGREREDGGEGEGGEEDGGADTVGKTTTEMLRREMKSVHGGWCSIVSDAGYMILEADNDKYANLGVDKAAKKKRSEKKSREVVAREKEKDRIRGDSEKRMAKNNLAEYVKKKAAKERDETWGEEEL